MTGDKTKEYDWAKVEGHLTIARQLVLMMFENACQIVSPYEKNGPQYDHQCMSTYEYAQQKLIEWGMIDKKECVRK